MQYALLESDIVWNIVGIFFLTLSDILSFTENAHCAIIPAMSIYSDTLERQKEYFRSGSTLSCSFRKRMLRTLKETLKANEDRILEALAADLGKSPFEGYATELGIAYEEIGYLEKHLGKLMRKTRVSTPITQFKSKSYIIHEPLGNTLIMSPWNYPLQLTIVPLAGAIAGGNTAIVKPSRYSRNVSSLLKEILENAFPQEYIAVFEGGHETNTELLALRWDFIFFTGSPAVGRIVHRAANEHLTPCVLELGGKSPVIIDGSADIALTARRLAWGKFLNAGQTCVAPDYALVKEGMEKSLIEALDVEIKRMFTSSPLTSPDLPKIINRKHFDRVNGLIAGSEKALGGRSDDSTLRIEPTVLYPVKESDAVMQEEIFGPVLPILTYKTLDEAIDFIRSREKPLALYIFSRDKKAIGKVLSTLSFGGGCVNDTVVHLTASGLSFGGIGNSGMGSYHGRRSFETFTHDKSIMDKALYLDLPVRYAPFKGKLKLLKLLMR